MTNALRILILITVVLSIAIPGVFALWQYSQSAPPPVDTTVTKSIFEFKEFKGVYIKSAEIVSKSNVQVTTSSYSPPALHEVGADASASGGSVEIA